VIRAPNQIFGTTFGTLGPGFYDGLAGVAWFLSQLHAMAPDREFERTALAAMRQSLQIAPPKDPKFHGGFFTGNLGIAIVAMEVARRLADHRMRRDGLRLFRATIGGNRKPDFDVMSGAAGEIVGLLLLAPGREASLLDRAVVLGDTLIRRARRSGGTFSWHSSWNPKRPNLTGFSHGSAGIGYALMELFAATGLTRFRDAADRAFAYERMWFDDESQNWLDFRYERQRTNHRASRSCAVHWCHGAPGIALSRIRAAEITGDAQCENEARAAIATTQKSVERALQEDRADDCLCHGVAGNAAVLYEASRRFADGNMHAIARKAALACERAARRQGYRSVSLFLGSAGVGYVNLKLADPRIPSVVLPRPRDFQ